MKSDDICKKTKFLEFSQVHRSSNPVCSTAQSAAMENSKSKKLQTLNKTIWILMTLWFWMVVMKFMSGLELVQLTKKKPSQVKWQR